MNLKSFLKLLNNLTQSIVIFKSDTNASTFHNRYILHLCIKFNQKKKKN